MERIWTDKMARSTTTKQKIGWTIIVWTIALAIFFPVIWTFLTSFKTEGEAIANPPVFFNFDWNLDNYKIILAGEANYPKSLMNSIIIALGSTLLGLVFAVPAAWSMAFQPGRWTKDILMAMLGTKMMPAVGVLMPIYLFLVWIDLLDSRIALVVILMMMNLPIIIWMLYTYFKEIPKDILEASRMDGASLRGEILYVLVPMAIPGIASTMLLNIILAWNEAFWTIILTTTSAKPLSAFMVEFSTKQGLFYAQLSAASVMAIAPILIMGWFSQKQLVSGLTFGAVK